MVIEIWTEASYTEANMHISDANKLTITLAGKLLTIGPAPRVFDENLTINSHGYEHYHQSQANYTGNNKIGTPTRRIVKVRLHTLWRCYCWGIGKLHC